MRSEFKPWVLGAAAALLVACGGGGGSSGSEAQASAAPERAKAQAATGAAARFRLQAPEAAATARIDTRLRRARGTVDVWVSLEQNSVAAQRAALAEAAGLTDRQAARNSQPLRAAMREHRQRLREAQAGMAGQLGALGAKELARVQGAHNAIAVRIDASQLQQLAAMGGVAKVRPVLHYRLTLAETVPYIGAAAVQTGGIDGTGVRVAVIDSGIDYTHRNLGGAGTAAAYAAAYGTATTDPRNTTLDGLFPTVKVVAGYDFVGESWPNCAPGVDCRSEDPDPIDLEGHGTHVADIIAGKSLDGTHRGVAPGASLVAIKACSAVSSSCNGIALLKAVDFALDPNGDGDTEDAVDVINMSLGSDYGQAEDDLSFASGNAVKLGVVVVASAGNGSNKPYVVGSPSIAAGVLSVAQTQVPSEIAIPLVVNTPAAIAGVYGNTATVDWAPVGAGVTGDTVFVGRGCPAGTATPNNPADDAYLASPSGKIALVDRGGCSVSLKVDRAVKAGATGVVIGLVAPGDAVTFSNGGGTEFKPTLVIQQSLSNAIKAQLAGGVTVNVSITPAAGIPLAGSMASTSSRGPSSAEQTIKPEIGAPGASRSAIAGGGTAEEAFGGTSGAAPMVAGAAALMVQAHPQRNPLQIKAMLMNSAETAVYTNPATVPGELAPVTRIGAGEVRVNRAIALTSAAFNRESKSAALSFGAPEVAAPVTIERTLRVANFDHHEKLFDVTPTFRHADDQARGAVRVIAPSRVRVGPHGREDITVRIVIDPTKLPAWTLDGGAQGGSGSALNGPEVDGYLTLTAGSEKLSIPWHVLPRKAADAETTLVDRGNAGPLLRVRNRGLDASSYDVFSLAGVSRRIPRGQLPGAGDNAAVVDLRAVGVRYLPDALTGVGADLIEFAINTSGRRAHPNYPAEFDIYVDATGDGVDDYVVYNTESGGFGASGQNRVYVLDLATDATASYFFTDADLNSGNAIFTVPLNIGPGSITLAAGATLGFSAYVFDNYFTGDNTDAIEGMRFTPAQPRFGVVGAPFGAVPARGSADLGVTQATLPAAASSELGLLMMYRRNAEQEADPIRIR